MKSLRHKKIVEIIQRDHIETQDALAEKLQEAGFQVTQATVSRDIRQLKLTKTAGKDGRQYYVMPRPENLHGDKYSRVLREGFVRGVAAENILVIKTVSGMAMAVAAALDAMDWPELTGTIAGDDTVFCAIRTRQETEGVLEKVLELVEEKGI